MSSEIKNDPYNPPKYLIVVEIIPSSTKVAEEM